MTSDRAPVVATWLVERFWRRAGDCRRSDRGVPTRQSRLWDWRQALIAVFACSGTRIWDHKWLTLRAIATGWIFASIVIRFGMREMVHPWWDSVAPPALYPVIASLAWLANGWVIGRLHRPYSTAMVSAVRALAGGPIGLACLCRRRGRSFRRRQHPRLGTLVTRDECDRHDLRRPVIRVLRSVARSATQPPDRTIRRAAGEHRLERAVVAHDVEQRARFSTAAIGDA